MTNNDTKFGTFNKKTHIYHQTDEVGTPLSSPKVFIDLVEAQTYFMPPELMIIFNECMTNLQWALVQDENGNNTKLKVTFDFGIKEHVSDPDEQWAQQFNIGRPPSRANQMHRAVSGGKQILATLTHPNTFSNHALDHRHSNGDVPRTDRM